VANGPCVEAFEAKAARWLGGTGGVAVNSGTSALHLALLAVGAGPGTEVLLPAYCCAALLNAVHLAGATPVLVDSVPGGFNLCPEDARHRVSDRTAAVVVAHLFGHPAPLEPFLELGIPVVEDCAQSLGATEGGSLTGSRGAVAICSFYATKVITTGQGGLVSTGDADRLALLRDLVDYDNREEWRPRFSYGISEMQAALGLWQLERLPEWLRRRRALAAFFDAELSSAPGRPGDPPGGAGRGPASPAPPPSLEPIHFRYPVRVPDADTALAALQERGIGAKRPVHRPLHHYFPPLAREYPHAEAAHNQLVSLPLYPALTDTEARGVVRRFQELRLPVPPLTR
jgi:dTDP-4-amino-4,6-dideoxygalactose transaminase